MKLSNLKDKYLKKFLLFFAGWLTIPSIAGGWIYDLFGSSELSVIWNKLTHPAAWLDNFTIYTIAFLTFRFLPDKITLSHWFMRIFYFACYYFILLKIIHSIIY